MHYFFKIKFCESKKNFKIIDIIEINILKMLKNKSILLH